jgi:hypothetical protein
VNTTLFPSTTHPRRKLRWVFVGLLLTALRCFSAPPDSPVGLVYYESGSTIARTSFSMAVVLREGGTYQGLFFSSTGPAAPPPITLNPEDGTWTYRKIDDTTAELTITTVPRSGPVSGVRSLKFSSDSAGFASRDDFGSGGSTGGLFRLVSPSSRAPLVNCSNRSFVPSGSSAFSGFVITDTPRAVLVRAVGPGLGQFAISDFLKTPKLTVTAASDGRIVASNTGWTTTGPEAIRRTNAITGAFALPEGSKDSATIVYLAAGAYVAEVNSADSSDSGQVLVEIYLLP